MAAPRRFKEGDKVVLTREGLKRFFSHSMVRRNPPDHEYTIIRYGWDTDDGQSATIVIDAFGNYREKWFESAGGPW